MAQRRSHPSVETPRGLIDLHGSIEYEDRVDIERYLGFYPDLRPIIPEAIRRLTAIYGPQTRFRLAVSHFPDDPEEGMLSLHAIIDLEVTDPLDLLDQFDQEWWINLPPEIQTTMIVDFTFA